MEIKSLCKVGSQWREVRVEVLLSPGLPQIQYLGLADRSIKEGSLRVKTALRKTGFEFPSSQQVIVNIAPSSMEKSSTGVDLAVAVGFLMETGQIPVWSEGESPIVFGELGLNGDVQLPSNFNNEEILSDQMFFGNLGKLSFDGFAAPISHLENLRDMPPWQEQKKKINEVRPEIALLKFNEAQSDWLILQNLGEFPSLLAGSQGAGKSTLVKALPYFLEQAFQGKLQERKLFSPHHSITLPAFIGGGSTPQAGEISRAHKGILFLDELLEFDVNILEALRRPFEEGQVEINRVGSQALFPCDAIIVGATNLCPCGMWIPGIVRSCCYTRARCLKSVNRLSGPFLDRFQMLYIFPKESPGRYIRGSEIRSRITEIRSWMTEQTLVPLKSLKFWQHSDFMPSELEILDRYFKNHSISERRRLSTLRVAKAIQWKDQAKVLTLKHLEAALMWTLHPFEKLESSIY